MAVRLIDADWMAELDDALESNDGELRIICPFIKARMLEHILTRHAGRIKVITRFNLDDIADGVSDIESLRMLLARQARVRGVRNLHAKLYLFGSRRVMLTSANLTMAAFGGNHEFGMISEDLGVIGACHGYFDDLWQRSGPDLQRSQIDEWAQKVTNHRVSGRKPYPHEELGDYGANIEIDASALARAPAASHGATQAFVKFLGESRKRKPLSYSIEETIRRTDCHHVLCYPKNKRPRNVKDGDTMFIARMTEKPNDMRIFGRAIGMEHQEERDNATEDEIDRLDWKREWPRYIRIYHVEFVAGTLENGVSLNELMDALEADSFASTQRNKHTGGNTNPRESYQRHPAVKLSQEGREWVTEKLQEAFDRHGKISRHDFDMPD